jgi:hypothetical protein
MCQLDLIATDELEPGGTATGLLRYAREVAEITKMVARVGSEMAS